MRRVVLRLALAVVAVSSFGACAKSEQRPSGVAEKWLQEVSNQGRSGLRDEATSRAAELGDEAAADELVPAEPEEDERYFSDLEVGRARVDGDTALVPFRLTVRVGGGDTEERVGALSLARTGDGWRVTEVGQRVSGLDVPSDGGPLPARARASHWIAALLLGVVLTAVCIVLVERQPQSTIATAA